MNQQVLKLLSSTAAAVALAVSAVSASAYQGIGENVKFDASADEPAPISLPPLAALAGDRTKGNPWIGENVPFDATAGEPSGTTAMPSLARSGSRTKGNPWIGENVQFDAAADDEPTKVAFEPNFPASETAYAGLVLDLPVDYYSEVTFPAMPDFGDEQPLLVASLDPTEAP